jgi:hypothetical protein
LFIYKPTNLSKIKWRKGKERKGKRIRQSKEDSHKKKKTENKINHPFHYFD